MTKNDDSLAQPQFSADQPIQNPVEDQYSRAPFAAGIAKSVLALPRGECFVIGIHGPWGDGKTSVLNFAAAALKGDPSVSVTSYNPWRFVNEEVMLSGFFATLAAAIRLELKTKGEKLASTLAKYGKYVAPADDRAAKIADLAARRSETSVEELRDRLRRGLAKSPKRIVVFIDDIDRLEASEIAALFRIIKSCADFPNVVYILAFDREMVAATLGERLAGGGVEAGRRFLEKIVQIPLAMPPASATDLDRACKRGVAEVLGRAAKTMTDSEVLRWQWAFQQGVSRRVRTPRNVAQYLNAVRFAYPLLADEVNVVDLMLAEALRVCYPTAYESIRANQRVFLGVPTGDLERRQGRSPQEDLLAAAKAGLSLQDGDALDYLVETLFPRYHVSRKGRVLGLESIRLWTSEKRICSPAYCQRFFSYAVGSSDVADKDIDAIVSAAGGEDAGLTHTLLDSQAIPLKQAVLVQKLEDRCTGFSAKASARLGLALATLSDRFDEPFSLQDRNHPGIQAAGLTVKLCQKIESMNQRLKTSIGIIEEAAEFWYVGAFMRLADSQFDPPLLDEEATKSLRHAFMERFHAFARAGVMILDLERRWKFEVLFSVARAAGRETVHDRFVPSMGGDGTVAIRILQCLTQPLYRSGEIIPSPDDLGLDDLDKLALLVDVDKMAKIVSDTWIREERQQGPDKWAGMRADDKILAQFWYLYPKWRENHQEAAQPATKQTAGAG